MPFKIIKRPEVSTALDTKQYQLKTLLGWELMQRFCSKAYFAQFAKTTLQIGDIQLSVYDLREADDYAYIVHTITFGDDRFADLLTTKADFINRAERPITSMSLICKELAPSRFEASCLFPLQLVFKLPPQCIKATGADDLNTVTAVTESMFPGKQAMELRIYAKLQQEIIKFDCETQAFCEVTLKGEKNVFPLPPVYQDGIASLVADKDEFGAIKSERALDDLPASIQELASSEMFNGYEYGIAPISTVEAVKRRSKFGQHNELIFSRIDTGDSPNSAELVALMIEEEPFNEFLADTARTRQALSEMRDRLNALSKTDIPIIFIRSQPRTEVTSVPRLSM